ncbi:MAG: hypothetical protein JNK05_16775 [Myxococcales bacterium]|nr:hypothetical protein [Myxococcales bacterium]
MRVYQLLCVAALAACRTSTTAAPSTIVRDARDESATDASTTARAGPLGRSKTVLAKNAFCVLEIDSGRLRCGGSHGTGQVMSGPRARGFVVGARHGCAIAEDRSLRCWGQMFSSGISMPSPPPRAPEPVEGATNIVELFGAGGSLVAKRDNGSLVYVYGAESARLRPRAIAVEGIDDVTRFEWLMPGRSGVARTSDGRWFAITTSPYEAEARATLLRDVGDATQWTHRESPCVRRANGTVACASAPISSSAFVEKRGLEGIRVLYATGSLSSITCAQSTDGRVFCWDDAREGALLAPGAIDLQRGPVEIAALRGARDVVTDRHAVCAALADRTVACINVEHYPPSASTTAWGGARTRLVGQRPVEGLANVERLALANENGPGVCAIGQGARTRCFATSISVEDAASVSALPSATREDFGGPPQLFAEEVEKRERCQQTRDGAIRCTPTIITRLDRSVESSERYGVAVFGIGDEPVSDVALGADGGCAIMRDGARTARCWSNDATDAVTVEGLRDVRSIAIGSGFRCALDDRGAVRCWGDGRLGQRGDGARGVRAAPDTIAIREGVTQITAGLAHACALLRDKTVQCWGWNALAQLGDRTRLASATPVAVAGLRDVRAIAAGSVHTCALGEDGGVFCWGSNNEGQCAHQSAGVVEAPTEVVALRGASEIAVSDDFVCARHDRATRSVRCFGGGARLIGSQLALGSPMDSVDGGEEPRWLVQLPRFDGARSLAVGPAAVCATLGDGRVRCASDGWTRD